MNEVIQNLQDTFNQLEADKIKLEHRIMSLKEQLQDSEDNVFDLEDIIDKLELKIDKLEETTLFPITGDDPYKINILFKAYNKYSLSELENKLGLDYLEY